MIRKPRAQPYRLSWPLNAEQVEQTDQMLQELYDDIRNGSINLVDLSGVLEATSGGTGLSSYAVGDLLYADTVTTLTNLAVGTVGKVIRSNGTLPIYSTFTIPNTFAVGDILYSSATNVLSALAAVAVGQVLTSAGVLTAPAWSETPHVKTLTLYDAIFTNLVDSPSNPSPESQRGVSTGTFWSNVSNLPDSLREHGEVVYKNRIWTIGGAKGAGPTATKKVYYSYDGLLWVEAGSDVLAAAIAGLRAVVFDGKMWMLGKSGAATIYTSTDGVTWTSIGTLPSAITGDGYSAVVFGGKMWVIGQTASVSQVYSSRDGVTWTAISTLPTKIRQHDAIVFGEKIWVIGGFNDSTAQPVKTVYYSSDGVTWAEAGTNTLPVALWGHSCLAYRGYMWLIGGAGGDPTYTRVNTVYYSADGITWTSVGAIPLTEAVTLQRSVVFNGKMWVMGGWIPSGTGNSAKVTTTEGVTLTDGVTGTLAVLNGGTGSTTFTAGSIIFSNGTILTQDNANLFWDDSNNRLGIGVTVPTALLHLKAGTAAANTAPIKLTSGTLLSTPESGAVEWDGANLFITV